MANVVMLMRHAEKPLGERPPHGVTEDGVVDRGSLTPRGWQRAGALVGFFVGAGTDPGSSGLPVPSHLFASQVEPQRASRRSLQTLQPLAERLGLGVDTSFLQEEILQLAQAISATADVALVSWEHHLIPPLARALIGERSLVPQIWPDDRFDVVWVFERDDWGQDSASVRSASSSWPVTRRHRSRPARRPYIPTTDRQYLAGLLDG